MGKQRKQRQQPSKKKVQVKQKIAKQDSGSAAPAKKSTDAKIPEDAKHIQVYGLNNLGNTCFYNSALQVRLKAWKLIAGTHGFCCRALSCTHISMRVSRPPHVS